MRYWIWNQMFCVNSWDLCKGLKPAPWPLHLWLHVDQGLALVALVSIMNLFRVHCMLCWVGIPDVWPEPAHFPSGEPGLCGSSRVPLRACEQGASIQRSSADDIAEHIGIWHPCYWRRSHRKWLCPRRCHQRWVLVQYCKWRQCWLLSSHFSWCSFMKTLVIFKNLGTRNSFKIKYSYKNILLQQIYLKMKLYILENSLKYPNIFLFILNHDTFKI